MQDCHKVLFMSRSAPIDLKSVFQVATNSSDDAAIWAHHASRKFLFRLDQHNITATDNLLTSSNLHYFCLFTWNYAFHLVAEQAVQRYMQKALQDAGTPLRRSTFDPLESME